MLIECGRSPSVENGVETAIQISENMAAWDRVMRLAHWHRMSGMLFSFLRDHVPADKVPSVHFDHLREHHRHTAMRSLFIGSEFLRVVRALQAENIDVMALKGAALLGTRYKDLGTREMSDIDLLVKPESANRAQEIVSGFGYEPVGDVSDEHQHLPRLHSHTPEHSFEIHTHMVSADGAFHFEIESVWNRAQLTDLHGVKVYVPSPEHMLLHLCLHFFLDRRFTSSSGLRQLHDVARVIEDSDSKVDWNFFSEEIRQNNLERPVYSVLSVVSKLMDVDVPASVLTDLRPADYSDRLEELFVRQRVLTPRALTATELVPHESVYTFGAVIKGVFRRIVPSKQYMETHYGHDDVHASSHTRMRRFGELMQRTFGYARNPLRLWQEIQIDRWMHSLSSDSPRRK